MRSAVWISMIACLIGLVADESRAAEPMGGDVFDESETLGIRLLLGPTLSNYSLGSAQGFSLGLPLSVGYSFGGEARLRLGQSGFSLSLRYLQTESRNSGIPSLSPDFVNISRNQADLLLHFHPFQSLPGKFFERLKLGLGAEYLNRSASVTTPYEAVTSLNAVGAAFRIGYGKTFGASFDYELSTLMVLPFSLKERNQKSGYPSGAAIFEFSGSIGYEVTEVFAVGLSVTARHEGFGFDGTGTRNTVQASDNAWLFEIPAEIRFRF